MFAKLFALVIAAHAAAAVTTITLDCSESDTHRLLNVVVRYMVQEKYLDSLLWCDSTVPTVNGQYTTSLAVPTGTPIAFIPLHVGATLTSSEAGFCGSPTEFTPSVCQSSSLTSDITLFIKALTVLGKNNYALIDCGSVTRGVTVTGTFRENVAGQAAGPEDQFTCTWNSVVAPTNTLSSYVTTVVGFLVFQRSAEAPFDYEMAITDGSGAALTLIRPIGAVISSAISPYLGTCAVSDAYTMQLCNLVNPKEGFNFNSWSFPIVGGVVAEEPACTYTCSAIGNQGACAVPMFDDASAVCSPGAAAFVSTECRAGENIGGVVTCVFDDTELTTDGVASAITAINNSPNPQASYAAFIAVFVGSSNGGAYATLCTACAAQALATGGSINCALCAAAPATTRRQAVGLNVVYCPQVDLAAQDACLVEAACAGALNVGSVCFRAGQAIVCPSCPVAVEESSSSKKGLLGLLGLLAIIPLVLILCSCCLLCVLLARKKKTAAVLPPTPQTVLPMTLCEPAVVSTMMPGMSPYGSAYPCM